jgi:hypothetical protein
MVSELYETSVTGIIENEAMGSGLVKTISSPAIGAVPIVPKPSFQFEPNVQSIPVPEPPIQILVVVWAFTHSPVGKNKKSRIAGRLSRKHICICIVLNMKALYQKRTLPLITALRFAGMNFFIGCNLRHQNASVLLF